MYEYSKRKPRLLQQTVSLRYTVYSTSEDTVKKHMTSFSTFMNIWLIYPSMEGCQYYLYIIVI